MALATLPRSEEPGLLARVSSLASALGAEVADLDPGLLLGSDAVSVYGVFCHIERFMTAGKTLLAPRIEETGSWEQDGHRSAAGLLATLDGGTTGAARRTLEAGRALPDLPGTEEALRQGSLSGAKLTEVTQAGSLDPASEESLLAGIGDESLQVIKERCQKTPGHLGHQGPRGHLVPDPCQSFLPLLERRRRGLLLRGTGLPRAGSGPPGPIGPRGQPPGP